jgi:uncharacterized HhH-GPD family protein
MTERTFPVTGDADADELLVNDPLALLIGMLLDQQVPMEWAFRSPSTLKARLGGRLDCAEIAAMGPDAVAAVFSEKPALHRFPGSMGKRTQALCQHIVDEYGGRPAALWEDAEDAADLWSRIRALPGYGDEKAMIFLALLGKRWGVAPEGWEEYAGPFADANPRSVADIANRDDFDAVRAWKKAQKQKGKSKQD